MNRTDWIRRLAIAAMVLVTGYSVRAWAQPHGAGHEAAAEHAEHAEGEAGEHEEAPGPINWTDFGNKEQPPFLAVLINFAILAGGYYFLGRKGVAAGLQNRRDTIAKDIEDAQRMKHEAEERAKTYQSKLETLQQELDHARQSLVKAGEADGERIVREAEAKAERMRRDAEFLIEQEMKQLRADLMRETVEAAVLAAEELLKKRVTQADQERLAEDYLADLMGQKPAPRAVSIPAARPPSTPSPAGSGGGSLS